MKAPNEDQRIEVRNEALDKWVPAVIQSRLSVQFTYIEEGSTQVQYMLTGSPDWRMP
jgi:hypothetical protein